MENNEEKIDGPTGNVTGNIPKLNYEYLFFELHNKVKNSYNKHENLSHNRSYDSGILLGMILKEMELITTIMDQAINGQINFVTVNPNQNSVPTDDASLENKETTKLYV